MWFAARAAGRQARHYHRLEQKRWRAEGQRLARQRQARRDQRQRELAHRDRLGLVRWLAWMLEPGQNSNSALRAWLADQVSQVQGADQVIGRSVQRHQARQVVLVDRQDRAAYRDHLSRGIIAHEGTDFYSLRGAHLAGLITVPPVTARSHRTRHRDDFPSPAHRSGSTDYYRLDDLAAFYQRHPGLLPGRSQHHDR